MKNFFLALVVLCLFGFASSAQAGETVCENGTCSRPIVRVVTAPVRAVQHVAAKVATQHCCRVQQRQCRRFLRRHRCCN